MRDSNPLIFSIFLLELTKYEAWEYIYSTEADVYNNYNNLVMNEPNFRNFWQ